MMAAAALHRVSPMKWRETAFSSEREVPAETAIAVVCNGTTHAVMMATPDDIQDFACGFALTEGLVRDLAEIEEYETVIHPNGLEARLWLAEERARTLSARRRHMAGPTGCGMCGIESLDQALREVPAVAGDVTLTPADILQAMTALSAHQDLHARTRAVHAAAYWSQAEGLVAVREDVGRHNALDKLIGCLARQGHGDRQGLLLLTSRVSVEMVQKAAIGGFPALAAVSAPTATALRTAEAAGMTVIGITRSDGFEVFTCARRVDMV